MTSADKRTDFLTVATVSYARQALATLRSARLYGQFDRLHFFALDATAVGVEALRQGMGEESAWISIFGPHDLENGHRDVFLQAFQYYNAIEMSCLAKYAGTAHVLGSSVGADRCIYADADILFLGSMTAVIDEMGDRAILLTPHQFGPSRDDAEHDYLLHGWINAGFFAANGGTPAAAAILDWLVHRISRRGFLAPGLGLSCDQTWVSLLPALFDGQAAICRNPGCNVAYWNLDERPLTRAAGSYSADGQPLLFFHFSGFVGAARQQLTKHGSFPVEPGTVLDELCSLYQAALDACAGLSLSGIATLPLSQAALRERIATGARINGLNIEAPTIKRGLFSRLGSRLDALLLRWLP